MDRTSQRKVKRPFDGKVGCPRGFAAACLLLLLSESDCHGYELASRVRHFGLLVSDPSPIYAQLRDLEAAQLIHSRLGDQGQGPPPKLYALTPLGEETLQHCRKHVTTVVAQLQDFLGRVEALAG